MILFRIENLDFTNYITVPDYTVNETDVYTEWTDANKINHRQVVRQRIEGAFTMRFSDKNDYFTFLDAVNRNKRLGGYISMEVYVNNLNEVKQIDAYMSMEPANTLPLFKSDDYDGFEVTIEER